MIMFFSLFVVVRHFDLIVLKQIYCRFHAVGPMDGGKKTYYKESVSGYIEHLNAFGLE